MFGGACPSTDTCLAGGLNVVLQRDHSRAEESMFDGGRAVEPGVAPSRNEDEWTVVVEQVIDGTSCVVTSTTPMAVGAATAAVATAVAVAPAAAAAATGDFSSTDVRNTQIYR